MNTMNTRLAYDGQLPLGSSGSVVPFPIPRAEHPPRDSAFSGVLFASRSGSGRLVADWRGVHGEIVRVAAREPLDSEYCGPFHLLIAYEGVVREEGESTLEGVSSSTQRDLRQKLTFVPAGRRFRE